MIQTGPDGCEETPHTLPREHVHPGPQTGIRTILPPRGPVRDPRGSRSGTRGFGLS